MNRHRLPIVASVAAAALVLACPVRAAEPAAAGGPPTLSANPGNHAIFPAKGQTPEQQARDERESYAWATQQTGWDPYKAQDERARQGAAAAGKVGDTGEKALKGAAGGAVLGLAVGAIADDAGKGAAIGAAAGGLTGGMRSRQSRQGAKASTQAVEEAYRRQFQIWDNHFTAAMEGKGYVVK